MGRSRNAPRQRVHSRTATPTVYVDVIDNQLAGDTIKLPDGAASTFVSSSSKTFLERLKSTNEPEIIEIWESLRRICTPAGTRASNVSRLRSAAKHLLFMATNYLDEVTGKPLLAVAEQRRRDAIVHQAVRRLAAALRRHPRWKSASIGELWDYYQEIVWRLVDGRESDLVLGQVVANMPTVMQVLERLAEITKERPRGRSNAVRPNRSGATATQFREKIIDYLISTFGAKQPTEIVRIAHGLTLAAFYGKRNEAELVTLDAARMQLRRILGKRT